jgi:AraC family transcriptional regulator of adaptative response / DNA-3-methyladenine glycosylase II
MQESYFPGTGGEEVESESGARSPPLSVESGMTGPHVLAFHPPLEWRAVLSYLAARATPGIEAVTTDQGGRYWRSVRLAGRRGWIVAGRARRGHTLEVEVSAGLAPVINPLIVRLRRLFDLDASPDLIATHLSADARLAPLVAARPGLRKAGTVDGSSSRCGRCWASR